MRLRRNELTQIRRLRERVRAFDRRLLKLIADRQAIAGRIGRRKAELGLPARDFKQEMEVVERARLTAAEFDLREDVAVRVIKLLVRASLVANEQISERT